MRFKAPKNTDKIVWTKHSIEKMQYYKLSENRLKRVLRNPDRKEEGIAPETVAIMQRTGSKKHPTEIWLMYQIIKSKVKSQKLKVIRKVKSHKRLAISGNKSQGQRNPYSKGYFRRIKQNNIKIF